MSDLLLGFALLAALSGVFFVLGCRFGRTRPVWMTNLLGRAAVVGLAAYSLTLRDNILLARLLPVSNLIVVGNWFPLGMSFLGGLAWSAIPPPGARGRWRGRVAPQGHLPRSLLPGPV